MSMSSLEEAVAAAAKPQVARIGVDELCVRYTYRVYRFAAFLSRSREDAEERPRSVGGHGKTFATPGPP